MTDLNVFIIHVIIIVVGVWNGYLYFKACSDRNNNIAFVRKLFLVIIIIFASGFHNFIENEILEKIAKVLFQIHWLYLIHLYLILELKKGLSKKVIILIIILDIIYVISVYFLLK